MSDIKLKWYGTAAILLEKDGTRLLFDPFIPINGKVYQPPVDELSTVDNIFITHGHYDHISSVQTILRKSNGKPMIYCTAKPMETLISKGVDEDRIHKITHGDVLNIGPFKIHVLKGKHIVFDIRLILKTFFNFRILSNWENFRRILAENKDYDEAGETVAYDIGIGDKHILLLGSLNLDDNTEYPEGPDLLILPFQGRSDIIEYAMTIIDKLRPKNVFLDHFDDTFPPISSSVNPQGFLTLMGQKYPCVSVICQEAGKEFSGKLLR